MRWWSELRRPALKCERVGHQTVSEWRRGYVQGRGGWLGGVVDRVRDDRSVCSRCGQTLTEWERKTLKCVDSFSAPAYVWDLIQEGGWWPERGRCPSPQTPAGGEG